MQRTSRRRFVTFEKSLTQNIRAVRRRELAAQWINLNNFDTRRRSEIGRRSSGRGELHEFCPDRERRLSSGKPELRFVVEAHPNNRQQVWGISNEPSILVIVGGSGLARSWSCKTPSSRRIRRAA